MISGKIGVVVDFVLVGILAIVAAAIEYTVKPFEQDFLLDDVDISYPNMSSTIDTATLLSLAMVLPVAGFVVVHVLLNVYFGRRRSALRLAFRVLGMLEALVVTYLLTNVLKVTVGRLRPDFLSRCKWNDELEKCTGSEGMIEDGRKSFPSGHASIAFAMMSYLMFYLAFEFDIYQVPNHLLNNHDNINNKKSNDDDDEARNLNTPPHERQPAMFTRIIITISPLFIAIIIAVSRLWDNKHHPGDVIGGAILGTTCSYLVFWAHHQHGHIAEESRLGASKPLLSS